MSKKERTKTLLDTFKMAIFVFIGALLAMFAFAGTNYKTLLADRILLVLFLAGIVFVVLFFGHISVFFHQRTKNFGENEMSEILLVAFLCGSLAFGLFYTLFMLGKETSVK